MYVDLTRDHPSQCGGRLVWFSPLPRCSHSAFATGNRAPGQFPSRQPAGWWQQVPPAGRFRHCVGADASHPRITLTEGKQFGNNPRCLRDDSRPGYGQYNTFERTREGSAPEIASDSADRSCAATRNGTAALGPTAKDELQLRSIARIWSVQILTKVQEDDPWRSHTPTGQPYCNVYS